MNDLQQPPSSSSFLVRNTLWLAGVLLLTAMVLNLAGRVFWCKCGSWSPWSWDIWTMHNSQHLIDPYSFSHILHGIIFYGALHVCCKSAPLTWRFRAAMIIEAGWEILENSPLIINRYREVTISLDYFGDSIANSLADILACAIGFLIAARLKPSHTVVIFILTELVLVATIRDSLILNVIMLVYPIDAIRQWQLPG